MPGPLAPLGAFLMNALPGSVMTTAGAGLTGLGQVGAAVAPFASLGGFGIDLAGQLGDDDDELQRQLAQQAMMNEAPLGLGQGLPGVSSGVPRFQGGGGGPSDAERALGITNTALKGVGGTNFSDFGL